MTTPLANADDIAENKGDIKQNEEDIAKNKEKLEMLNKKLQDAKAALEDGFVENKDVQLIQEEIDAAEDERKKLTDGMDDAAEEREQLADDVEEAEKKMKEQGDDITYINSIIAASNRADQVSGMCMCVGAALACTQVFVALCCMTAKSDESQIGVETSEEALENCQKCTCWLPIVIGVGCLMAGVATEVAGGTLMTA